MINKTDNRRGSILVMTVWVIFILTIFVMTLADIVGERIFFSQGYKERAQAYLAAFVGIDAAIAEIAKDTQASNYDTLKESWSNNAERFNSRPVADAFYTVSHSIAGESGDGQIFYGMTDEERKINVNTAPEAVLSALFRECWEEMTPDEAKSIANAIIDWRDEDSEVRTGGAEDNYYMALANYYHCKNKPLDFAEELLLVKGVTADIFKKVQDYITVYGEGRVNINTAPAQVLEALGLPEVLAGKIISYRAGQDDVEGTEDDRFFTEIPSIVSQVNQAEPLTQDELQQLNNLIVTNMVNVKSSHFRIQVKGYTSSGGGPKNMRNITCIIRRNGKILFWKE
jgi:general secretion pathway protein K